MQNDNQKRSKYIPLFVGAAAFLILFITMSYSLYTQQKEVSQLKKTVADLKQQKNTLETTVAQAKPKSSVLPLGFKEFKSETEDFSFAYPQEWGSLTFDQKSNGRKIGHFSNYQDLIVRLHDKNMTKQDTDTILVNLYDYKTKVNEHILQYTGLGDITLPTSSLLAESRDPGQEFILYSDKGLGYYFGALGKMADGKDYSIVIFDFIKGRNDKAFTLSDPQVAKLLEVLRTFKSSN